MNPQHFSLGQMKIYLFLLPICIVMVLPIIFIFVNALKPLDELFAYPPRFYVRNPTLNNFSTLFSLSSTSNTPASRYLFNSIVSALLTVLFTLIVGTGAGYVLSKKHFRARNALLEINNLALMFCAVAVAIPRYFVIAKLGLLDTFWANIVPLLATPVGVFLIKQFMEQLPTSLLEAAKIDGAGELKIFWTIVMPNVKPAWLTLMVFSVQSLWNMGSSPFIYSEQLKTLSYAINQIVAGGIARAGVGSAVIVIMMIVPIGVFIFTQSNIIETMASSGLKD